MRTRSKTSRPRSATESADREPVLSPLESMGSRTVSARLFAPPSDYIIFLQAVKQIHLAGVRHPRKGPQGLQLLDMGLGQLAAAHGKLLHGDEGLALALFHRVLGGGLPQSMDGDQRWQQPALGDDEFRGIGPVNIDSVKVEERIFLPLPSTSSNK